MVFIIKNWKILRYLKIGNKRLNGAIVTIFTKYSYGDRNYKTFVTKIKRITRPTK